MVKNGNSSIAPQVVASKLDVYNFMENLFKMGMSEDVLADIVIDDRLDENKVIIVGRPKLLGSSTKQMRHVTPYSFVEDAIKSVIMETASKSSYLFYIDDIVKAIQPLIKSKRGVCLTSEQYRELLLLISSQDEIDEVFKFTTITQEQQQNEYHLVYNDTLVECFKQNTLDGEVKKQAFDDFNSKFEKYISYGIHYLTDNMINPEDLNVVTMTCEGLARIILTMFNQDKYAAFPQEGNSLLEEIRLYTNKQVEQVNRKVPLQKQKEQNVFKVMSHDEITKEIISSKKEKYDLRIRIVDNEGIKVRNTVEALRILDVLIDTKTSIYHTQNVEQDQASYNSKYNLCIKINGLDSKSYNREISVRDNLDSIFHHHVAKHLYVVFDFKPLEIKVLAPKHRKDRSGIKVYPSAAGEKTAEYSVQSGDEYREFQYNSRKGYNDKAVFRSEMAREEIKEILCKKIVSHIILSLIPFQSIKAGFELEDTQGGMRKVFKSFVDLVRKDYQNAQSKGKDGTKVTLDDDWQAKIDAEYEQQAKPSTIINTSGISKPEEGNYIQF